MQHRVGCSPVLSLDVLLPVTLIVMATFVKSTLTFCDICNKASALSVLLSSTGVYWVKNIY